MEGAARAHARQNVLTGVAGYPQNRVAWKLLFLAVFFSVGTSLRARRVRERVTHVYGRDAPPFRDFQLRDALRPRRDDEQHECGVELRFDDVPLPSLT